MRTLRLKRAIHNVWRADLPFEWLFNDLELPARDVAHQLGHTDGGALVQRLYGHPSERLARERIKRATTGKPSAVVSLTDAERRQP